MTIKFHATFAIGSLLLLLSMQPTAKADTIHVVGETDSVVCAGSGECTLPSVSFTLDFIATPVELVPYGPAESLDSVTGMINGVPVMGDARGFFPDTYGTELDSIFFDASDGSQYQISASPVSSDFKIFDLSTPTFSFITLDATVLPTPEPSSLLLLLLGTGALLVGLALFKSKSRTGLIV